MSIDNPNKIKRRNTLKGFVDSVVAAFVAASLAGSPAVSEAQEAPTHDVDRTHKSDKENHKENSKENIRENDPKQFHPLVWRVLQLKRQLHQDVTQKELVAAMDSWDSRKYFLGPWDTINAEVSRLDCESIRKLADLSFADAVRQGELFVYMDVGPVADAIIEELDRQKEK